MRSCCATLLLLILVTCGRATDQAPAVQKPEAGSTGLANTYQRENQPWLTHDESQLRRQTISDVVYRLSIDLTGEKIYSAEVVIEFNYTPSKFPLTLDFLGGTIDSISIAGESVPVNYNGNHVSIDSRHLSQGPNSIDIRYSNTYSETGFGLYRFVDSTDGRIYLYTHFEPFAANQLVPSFDQPNLRAIWWLEVRVPNDWVVVTTMRKQRIETDNGLATWIFPASPKISSYIFPLHAGQYHVWESLAGTIPLRLFARESMAVHVRAEWMLDITARGMAYFQEYFDEPYPFTKYDQLIVPDFIIGGMENVAAVTYTERYIPRGDPTRERLQGIAGTFLHELSHMWFGDLVTIDWWNALWLKESFASLMGPMALAEATDFKQAWLEFYIDDKQLAYEADQRVTTHPIEMPVRDTKSGDASFDRITYQKGASVLKQLNHFLGEETFREGVRAYFDRFAWQAVKLPDFMDTLAEVSGKNMHEWTRDWVETAGLNTVTAQYQCQDDRITTFSLSQTAPDDYPTLRNHRLQTGLYHLVDGAIELQRLVAVELGGANTPVPELIGEACPFLVYPNVGDWAYIKVRIDENSMKQIPANLNNIADPLLRSMLWFSLWDAVRDINISLSDFLDIALAQLPAETNTAILESLLKKLVAARGYLYLFGADAAALREYYLPAMEAMARQGLMTAKAGSDRQKQWFDAWLMLAHTPRAINEIDQWLNGDDQPASLNQDQDRRWQALIALSGRGYPGTKPLQDKEIVRDASDSGSESLLTVQAAWPDASQKAAFLDQVDDPDSSATTAELKAALLKMFPPGQESQHRAMADRILESLLRLDTERDQDFIEDYVRDLLPALCTTESVDRLANSIDERGDLGLIATKALRVAHQEDQRCVAMTAKQLATHSRRGAAPTLIGGIFP